MSITRRCDYACRIIRAAYKNGESFVSIAEVAEAEQIPYSFARSIQHELVKRAFYALFVACMEALFLIVILQSLRSMMF